MVEITEKEFSQLADYIHKHYGIHLKKEKQSLMTARLSKVMDQLKLESFQQYYEYLVSDKTGVASATLIDKISTNYTFFMREPAHFQYLQNTILPYMESTVKNKDLRIWSAGCATGEEPYTLALVLEDYFRNKPGWDKRILATDISAEALETASRGIYEQRQIESLPDAWKNGCFTKVDENRYRVSDYIRNQVIFRKLNLMDSQFPFQEGFNIIFCRNVMIYFDKETTFNLVNKYYNLTKPGGYLLISHTESLSRDKTNYRYIQPGVYRKI